MARIDYKKLVRFLRSEKQRRDYLHKACPKFPQISFGLSHIWLDVSKRTLTDDSVI